jgi:RNA polymerase sigma-70 factor (ECF subfamily)
VSGDSLVIAITVRETRRENCTSVPHHDRERRPFHRGAGFKSASDAACDLARFKKLILPHLHASYRFARFLVKDADAADDIVQEAFVRTHKAISTFRGGDARPWLFAIVRNCSLTWLTKARRQPCTIPLESLAAEFQLSRPGFTHASDAGPDNLNDPATPETILIREDQISAVRKTLATLASPFRETLVLREMEELSYAQIAERMEVPIGTVMSRLARARDMFTVIWSESFQVE